MAGVAEQLQERLRLVRGGLGWPTARPSALVTPESPPCC